MEEFVLLTLDENTSFLSSNIPVSNEQPPLETKSTNLDATSPDNLIVCGSLQTENTPESTTENLMFKWTWSLDSHKNKNKSESMRRLMTQKPTDQKRFRKQTRQLWICYPRDFRAEKLSRTTNFPENWSI